MGIVYCTYLGYDASPLKGGEAPRLIDISK